VRLLTKECLTVTSSEFVESWARAEGHTSTMCFLATAPDMTSKKPSSYSITLSKKDSANGPQDSARLGYMYITEDEEGRRKERERGRLETKGTTGVLWIKKSNRRSTMQFYLHRDWTSPLGSRCISRREHAGLIKRNDLRVHRAWPGLGKRD